MARPKLTEGARWALEQTYTVGRKCSICTNLKILKRCNEIVDAWVDPAIIKNPLSISWVKIADAIKEEFGTNTHWMSVRTHFRIHDPERNDRVEKRRRGET